MGEVSYWRLRDRYYRLLGSKCSPCGKEYFPPVRLCWACGSTQMADREMPGEGRILSYTLQQETLPGFEDQAPMIFAIVELTNRVRILAQIVDTPFESLRIGDSVRAVFRKIKAEGDSGQIFYGYKFVRK